MDFQEFPKMARLSRECVVTEKIDGTNGAVVIEDGLFGSAALPHCIAQVGNYNIYAQSRSRFITPDDDNYGFARWVVENAADLAQLGPGRHFGEWWGAGIQRKYGIADKRFSLFNTGRWFAAGAEEAGEDVSGRTLVPGCCSVVPVLLKGLFTTEAAQACISLLAERGSYAAPGFMDPEGIIVYHTAAGISFKKTVKKDEQPKGRG